MSLKAILKELKNKFVKNFEWAFVCFLTIILSITCLIGLSLGRSAVFNAYNNSTANITSIQRFCNTILSLPSPLSQIKIVSASFSMFLIILSILLPKKDCLRLNKWPGILFSSLRIENSFKKSDRMITACIYVIISYQVINATIDKLLSVRSLSFNDPTGLSTLLFQVIDVILIGLRYFPILISTKTSNNFLRFLTAIYMLVDIGFETYYEAVCNTVLFTISRAFLSSNQFSIIIYIIYISLYMLPNILLSNFLAVRLTIDSVTKTFKKPKSNPLNNNLDNVTELITLSKDMDLFYSECDIKYCQDLFRKKNPNQLFTTSERRSYLSGLFESLCYSIKNGFKNTIYDPYSNFRFTIRFVSAHVVSVLVVYCISMIIFIVNYGMIEDALLMNIKDTSANTSGIIFCQIKIIPCVDNKIFGLLSPAENIDTKIALWLYLLLPLFISFFIYSVQIIFGINNYKRDYLMLCKGRNYHIPSRHMLTKLEIAVSSFHFCGLIVGK